MSGNNEPSCFDHNRFEEAVIAMRTEQKAYFAAAKGTEKALKHLHASKKWEKTVDTMLLFRSADAKPQQSKLFR